MILTTHALVGGAVGKNIANPWLVIPISLAVHYALDILPHGEYLDENSTFKDTTWKVALDLLAGCSIVIFYIFIKEPSQAETMNIALGIFFSLFPDFLTLLYWKVHINLLETFYKFHKWSHTRISQELLAWNLKNARNDILVSLLAIFFLFIR